MQVILLENLEGKGAAGEVVKVADGYARNYLLPRNIAILATDSNRKTLEHRRAKLAERKAQDLEVAESLKAKIDSQSITFEAKSGESGRLFGSITSQDVADAIHEHFGVFVDKRKITDGTPIKAVGVHSVTIKIFPEVNAVMRILVGTPEQIEASEAAARLAAEKAAARAAAEAEAAARAEEEAEEAAAAADAKSDAPDYEERFGILNVDEIDAEVAGAPSVAVEPDAPAGADEVAVAEPVSPEEPDAAVDGAAPVTVEADSAADDAAPEKTAPEAEETDASADDAAPEEAAPALAVEAAPEQEEKEDPSEG